ncbi:MAG TPA: hypothetical protein VN666_17195 [Nitrospira sp.]|nr:hypothetical protein [Nitrospira sp.]
MDTATVIDRVKTTLEQAAIACPLGGPVFLPRKTKTMEAQGGLEQQLKDVSPRPGSRRLRSRAAFKSGVDGGTGVSYVDRRSLPCSEFHR